MMLVTALFTATAAAGPAAAAAGTVATAAAGASTALSVLQGVATAGSALFSLASGFSQAKQEDLAAQTEALRIKREELIKIGQLRVAFASSGVDISAGQPATLEEGIRDQSQFEQGLALSTGEMRASSARLKGIGQAFGTVGGGLIDIARRG
jgi:hypothetical protein